MIKIPASDKKRIVIIGAGFGGLKLAKELRDSEFQVVLIDRFNYHQFQPLFYQVATAGLEPSSISFPLRKIFHHFNDFYIRIAEVKRIDTENNQLWTTQGILKYDYLVLAYGAGNHFFGKKNLEKLAKTMKSTPEALHLRNAILKNFEDALAVPTDEEREKYLNLVVVGGGASGVEVSGALADMKKYVIPKDYQEIDINKVKIHLIQSNTRLLPTMSPKSSTKAKEYLEKLGVVIRLGTSVLDYDGKVVTTSKEETIQTNLVIWTAGIAANKIDGFKEKCYAHSNRILVDEFNRVKGFDNVFAIGDLACYLSETFPWGHPQVAPVALQQATVLGKNLRQMSTGKPWKPFVYKNKGTMATVGRNLALVDLPFAHFHGPFAWLIWMFVHLMSIVSIKNRLLVFFNWFWNYITYDQSLRLILRPKESE